jgi:hypothetical protein
MATEPVTVVLPRSLGTIVADCIVGERHEDDSVQTEHPVEFGTVVSDGAYDRPAELTLTYIWSLSTLDGQAQRSPTFLQDIYQQLLTLKSARPIQLVDIYTGKRHYKNMKVGNLFTETDAKHENIIELRVRCKEFIFARTQTVQYPGVTIAQVQAQQAANGPTPTPQQQTVINSQIAICHSQNRGTVQPVLAPDIVAKYENLP